MRCVTSLFIIDVHASPRSLKELLGQLPQEELRSLLSRLYFYDTPLDREIHGHDEPAAALLRSGRIGRASFLWSTVAKHADLSGPVWISGDDDLPAVQLQRFDWELVKRSTSLGDVHWSNSKLIRPSPQIWNSARNHTVDSRCARSYVTQVDTLFRHFASVRQISLLYQLVTFEGIMLDRRDMTPLSHFSSGNELDDKDPEKHPFFGPVVLGRAKYRDLLWASLAERLTSNAHLFQDTWHLSTNTFQEGLDGLEGDFFQCSGTLGLWRRGLLEVEVVSSLAMASHLWVVNYGHWFSYELPALIVLSSWLLADPSRKVLIHPLRRSAEVLSILGVTTEQVIILDPCKLYFARELRTVVGLFNQRPSRETLLETRRAFLHLVAGGSKATRRSIGLATILLADKRDGRARSLGTALRKAIASQVAVRCAGRCELKDIVQTSAMSFVEQIATFAQASVVIAPEGGFTANFAWLSSDAIAVVVVPSRADGIESPVETCGIHFGSDIAIARNISYWTYVTPVKSGDREPLRFSNSGADFDDFLQRLFVTKAMRNMLSRNKMTNSDL